MLFESNCKKLAPKVNSSIFDTPEILTLCTGARYRAFDNHVSKHPKKIYRADQINNTIV